MKGHDFIDLERRFVYGRFRVCDCSAISWACNCRNTGTCGRALASKGAIGLKRYERFGLV